MNVFTVTYDQLNVSLLCKDINLVFHEKQVKTGKETHLSLAFKETKKLIPNGLAPQYHFI